MTVPFLELFNWHNGMTDYIQTSSALEQQIKAFSKDHRKNNSHEYRVIDSFRIEQNMWLFEMRVPLFRLCNFKN